MRVYVWVKLWLCAYACIPPLTPHPPPIRNIKKWHRNEAGETDSEWDKRLDLIIYPVTDAKPHLEQSAPSESAAKKILLKKVLNTVKYMQSLKWQNRPTYLVLIWSAPAQMSELFSAELCTFKEVFSPRFLLRRISQLPTASISTRVTVETHTRVSKGTLTHERIGTCTIMS